MKLVLRHFWWCQCLSDYAPAAEVGNPRYMFDRLLSVIRLSVETMEGLKGLPGAGVGEEVEVMVSPF